MRVRGFCAASVVLGLVACVQGESKTETEPASGYVLLSADAQGAGYQIEGEASHDARLPVAVALGEKIALVGPGGRREVTVAADELVYVHGPRGELTRGKLDHEVARDRIGVGGTVRGAEALAARVEGVVDHHEGRAIVVGPDVLALAARGTLPAGVLELVPVKPGERAGVPAFPSVMAALPPLAPEPAITTPAPAVAGDLDPELEGRLARGSDALFPEAISCADPIAGVWVSREHFQPFGDWYRFELTIARDPGDAGKLQGTIVSRSWAGGASDAVPGACETLADASPGRKAFDWTIRMAATGTIRDGQVAFDGGAMSVLSTRCGPQMTTSSYRPDHFTGHLLANGRHLDARNNDGGRSNDEPHLFRRVSCGAPSPVTKPGRVYVE